MVYFWVCEKNSNAGTRIDLRSLQTLATGDVGVVYTPRQFGSAKVTIPCTYAKRGRILALVFSTGKVIAIGLDPSTSLVGADQVAREMSIILGKPMEARDVKMPNLVGKINAGPVDLEIMARKLGSEIAHWDPDHFPACFVSTGGTSDPVKYMIFGSGKIIITGCQSEEVLRQHMEKARQLCIDYASLPALESLELE